MLVTDLHRFRARATGTRGFTLIEVLVTIAVMLVGLLGVIGMQARAAVIEFESYQRGEALALVREMQARLTDSRTIVTGYLDSAVSSTDGSVYVGSGANAKDFSTASVCVGGAGVPLAEAKFEMCQWGLALQGTAAMEGTSKVGAMIGARGCLIRVVPAENNALADIYVTVVWQGKSRGAEPDADSPAGKCASAVNFGAGLRRGATVRVLVPDLHKAS
ncbi:prepilin-type N-terminal cleavage/methylation domain-containing protein [Variovorax paradoxus]|uniref:prepilin-type N-terminal cleavage/methylation domain-containing protein n=1 Tax=Variovorax paradoxus TaxID=34073 RepID=UPI0027888BE6|nr:prepilin-type N-terminal cleavage/methylation domain-containing protein [Variovorax paradoxus]MDP9932504.1 type IV pilus assembly protein PilV [Variovorax paradoxus]